jgi:hypothetical protein
VESRCPWGLVTRLPRRGSPETTTAGPLTSVRRRPGKGRLDLIRAEAARRAVTIHVVIDLIRVLEYIWKAAWSLHEAGDPAAEDWVSLESIQDGRRC